MKYIKVLLIAVLAFTMAACSPKEVPETDTQIIMGAMALVEVPATIEDFNLPISYNDVDITWTSSKANTLTEEYATIQTRDDQVVTFTAVFEYNGIQTTKIFNTTILALKDAALDEVKVNGVKENLTFTNLSLNETIALPILSDGVTIVWTSNNTACMSGTGAITRPEFGEEACTATLTATLSSNSVQDTKDFVFTVLAKLDTKEYLGYYQGATGLVGESLKTFLHNLIDDFTPVTYGDARDILQETNEDPNNPDNIILIYTGNSIPSTWDSGASWNREHVFPQSLLGAGSASNSSDNVSGDLHNLQPANPSVNTSRSNKEFDEGGNLAPNTTDCYTTPNTWEPRDEVKGDIARIIFYMAVRYESGDYADLEIDEMTDNSLYSIGKLSILLKWHLEDPVDDFERNRNDVIYSYQDNRNPFIDNPEFVELIWN